MSLRLHILPAGFIAPCLPTSAPQPPSGAVWLHEIKHDGFRVIARKVGERVRLYSRPGNDLTYRFALIVEGLARLRSDSCIIDGEAVACDDNARPCRRQFDLEPERTDGPRADALKSQEPVRIGTTVAQGVTAHLLGERNQFRSLPNGRRRWHGQRRPAAEPFGKGIGEIA
jgi:ATP-dependent DNA ligase